MELFGTQVAPIVREELERRARTEAPAPDAPVAPADETAPATAGS
jgi:hypothetical protein